MVLGMKYGRGENQDRALMVQTYAKTGELMDKFTWIRGTYLCRELPEGCELTAPEGQKEFQKKI
jgi:Putative redox-active protein (C_GCAxxG_C_C).